VLEGDAAAMVVVTKTAAAKAVVEKALPLEARDLAGCDRTTSEMRGPSSRIQIG
jgi:hypothetical protein